MSTQPSQRWRPPSFLEMFRRLSCEAKGLSERAKTELASQAKDLDLSMRVAYDGLYGLDEDRPVESGKRMRWGSTVVTGSKTGIVTGITAIESAVATIQSSAAMNEWVTLTFTDGNLSIYVWKPTAAGNTTPIASTTARTILWQVAGS